MSIERDQPASLFRSGVAPHNDLVPYRSSRLFLPGVIGYRPFDCLGPVRTECTLPNHASNAPANTDCVGGGLLPRVDRFTVR